MGVQKSESQRREELKPSKIVEILIKQDGSKEGRGRVMQCLLITKRRRYFPALICLTLGAIFCRSIRFDETLSEGHIVMGALKLTWG